MCGRFVQKLDHPNLFKMLQVHTMGINLTANFNVAPSQSVAIIMTDFIPHPDTQKSMAITRLEVCQWGLIPAWAKDEKIGEKMINARSETITEKPSFRGPIKAKRCIIPVNGFYEWSDKDGHKRPYYFFDQTQQVLALAGLWDRWIGPDGLDRLTFTVITTAANDFIAPYHHRMPVILSPEDAKSWLRPGAKQKSELDRYFRPKPISVLSVYPVSKQVNSPSFNTPDCLTPAT